MASCLISIAGTARLCLGALSAMCPIAMYILYLTALDSFPNAGCKADQESRIDGEWKVNGFQAHNEE